jgi:hypothetical protein
VSFLYRKNGALIPCITRADASFPVLEELHTTVEQASEDVPYAWLPQEALIAASHLLHASVLRHASKSSEAALHLSKAEDAVDGKLQELGIDLAVSDVLSTSQVVATYMRALA